MALRWSLKIWQQSEHVASFLHFVHLKKENRPSEINKSQISTNILRKAQYSREMNIAVLKMTCDRHIGRCYFQNF